MQATTPCPERGGSPRGSHSRVPSKPRAFLRTAFYALKNSKCSVRFYARLLTRGCNLSTAGDWGSAGLSSRFFSRVHTGEVGRLKPWRCGCGEALPEGREKRCRRDPLQTRGAPRLSRAAAPDSRQGEGEGAPPPHEGKHNTLPHAWREQLGAPQPPSLRSRCARVALQARPAGILPSVVQLLGSPACLPPCLPQAPLHAVPAPPLGETRRSPRSFRRSPSPVQKSRLPSCPSSQEFPMHASFALPLHSLACLLLL